MTDPAGTDEELTAAEPAPRRAPWWLQWRVALAGALAVSAAGVVYLGFRVASLERALMRRVGEVAMLQTRIEQQREVVAILSAADTRAVALAGLKPSPGAQGRMWWLRGRGGVFIANGLPPTPAGKTYQLWAIVGKTPVSAGIFDVGPAGTAAFRVNPPPAVDTVDMFAVTLEPAGGLPQPSGDMYLAGKVV